MPRPPGGYTVVEPPKGEAGTQPAQADRMFIYARQGQTEQQQAKDQYECHRWAVGQTGFDPTQPRGHARSPEALGLSTRLGRLPRCPGLYSQISTILFRTPITQGALYRLQFCLNYVPLGVKGAQAFRSQQ